MPKIDSFCIERFQLSLNTLTTFCAGGKSNKYYKMITDPGLSSNAKHSIYKGAFVESVEYLYGFIPEVFKEYCKQFGIEVYSRDGKATSVGYLDLFKSMKSSNKISVEHYSFLSNVYKTRGEIIHHTLISKESYYKKLSWIALQVEKYDLMELYRFVFKLYKEVNNSYDKGINKVLIVKDRREIPNNRIYNKSISPSKAFY